jgi:hypothetical protein
MKSRDAERALSKIDAAITEILSFTSTPPAEQAYLAKFLVVFISGIYEESIETIMNEMVGRLGKPEVSSFVEQSIHVSFRNPSTENVKALVGKFDLLPRDVKDALNSICSNKNALAHGNPVTLTLNDAIQYHRKAKTIIEKIDDMFL